MKLDWEGRVTGRQTDAPADTHHNTKSLLCRFNSSIFSFPSLTFALLSVAATAGLGRRWRVGSVFPPLWLCPSISFPWYYMRHPFLCSVSHSGCLWLYSCVSSCLFLDVSHMILFRFINWMHLCIRPLCQSVPLLCDCLILIVFLSVSLCLCLFLDISHFLPPDIHSLCVCSPFTSVCFLRVVCLFLNFPRDIQHGMLVCYIHRLRLCLCPTFKKKSQSVSLKSLVRS